MNWQRDKYSITDDKKGVDYDYVHRSLNSTYWAERRTRETVVESIENSTFFSLYDDTEMIGFARVVGDGITFAWLCDVFVNDEYRGKGLGKWLMDCVMEHPSMKECRINLLATRDAHELYSRYGFERKECMMKINRVEGNYP